MSKFLFFIMTTTILLLVGCQGQSKEELLLESHEYVKQGNYRGALVLLNNALEEDPAYQPARLALADIYLTLGQVDRVLSELKKAEVQGTSPELLLMRAEANLIQGNLDNALATIDALPEDSRQLTDALKISGRVYATQEKWSLAEDMFRKAITANSKDPEARLSLCRVLERQQQTLEAQVCLKDYIAQWPSRADGVLLLAQLQIQQGQSEEALKHLDSFVQAGYVDEEVLYRLGTLYLQQRNYSRAKDVATTLSEQAPTSRYGALLKGQNALLERKLDQALRELTKAAKVQRDNMTEFMLGLTRYEMGQYEQALNHFQGALDQDPEFVQARVMVASTLLKQKRFDDSLTAAENVLDSEPGNLQALRIVAAGYMAKEQFDKADAYLQRAVEIAPDQHDLYLRKSEFEFLTGDVTASLNTLKTALERDPQNLRARLYLVADATRRQDYQYAEQIIREGLAGMPADAVLKNMLGRLYLDQGRLVMANKQFEEAKVIKPDFKAPHFNLAQIALKQANHDVALSHFDNVLKFDPRDLSALLNKARLHEVTGSSDKALSTLLLARDTGAPQGLLALAQFYAHKGRFDDALTSVDEGLAKDPESLPLLSFKAVLHEKKGEFDPALDVYQQIEKIEEGRGYTSAILMAIRQDKKAVAEQLVAKVKESSPDSTYSYLLESFYLEHAFNPEKALEQLNRNLVHVTEKHHVYKRIAYLSNRSGRIDEALRISKRWVEDEPGNYEAHFTLASYFEQIGEFQSAAQSYLDCLKLNKIYVPAMNNLAYLYTDQMKRPQEALPLAQKAVQLNPGNGAVLDTLGYVHYNLKQYDIAKDLLQKAVNVSPEQGTIRFHLAQALLKLGEKEAAKRQLQASLNVEIAAPKADVEKLLNSL